MIICTYIDNIYMGELKFQFSSIIISGKTTIITYFESDMCNRIALDYDYVI
jgi:hypothetical protein